MANIICSECGEPQPTETPFCQYCGAFLDWDQGERAETVQRTAMVVPDFLPVMSTEGRFQITSDQTSAILPATGESATLIVQVRNTSPIVDGYRVEAPGAPSWLIVESDVIHVLPGAEEALTVRMRVDSPRLPPARQITVVLRVISVIEDGVHQDTSIELTVPSVDVPAQLDARVLGTRSVAAGRIFISYRRADSIWPTGWLYAHLVSHFGREDIIRDIDSIEPGDDFVEVIGRAVAACDVMLVVIGTHWASIEDSDGNRRLDDPEDFVRREIEAALQREVRVIPILVDGATMPRTEQLPRSLTSLRRRQALELSPQRFEHDADRLLRVLDGTVSEEKRRR